MEKTILIGTNNKFSAKTNKWLKSLSGLFMIIVGIGQIWNINSNNIEQNDLNLWGAWNLLWIAVILIGIFQIVFGLTAFSINSEYAMRLKVNDSQIEFKSTYFKSATQLNWNDIKQIKLDAYQINFQLDKRNEVFRYGSNSNISIEIKKTLREIAEEKNIPVIGG